jgi:hypothetical protein
VDAPFALRVVELPMQIVDELTVTVGSGLTVTIAVVVPVQPPDAAVSV